MACPRCLGRTESRSAAALCADVAARISSAAFALLSALGSQVVPVCARCGYWPGVAAV